MPDNGGRAVCDADEHLFDGAAAVFCFRCGLSAAFCYEAIRYSHVGGHTHVGLSVEDRPQLIRDLEENRARGRASDG